MWCNFILALAQLHSKKVKPRQDSPSPLLAPVALRRAGHRLAGFFPACRQAGAEKIALWRSSPDAKRAVALLPRSRKNKRPAYASLMFFGSLSWTSSELQIGLGLKAIYSLAVF